MCSSMIVALVLLGNADQELARAWRLMEENKPDASIRAYEAIKEKWAGDSKVCATAQSGIGKALYEKKEYAASTEAYRRVEADYPQERYECAKALVLAGMSLRWVKEHVEATELFGRVLADYSDVRRWAWSAALGRANSFWKLKDYRRALECHDEVMRDFQDQPAALVMAGWESAFVNWHYLGDDAEARKRLEAMLSRHLDGSILQPQGDWDTDILIPALRRCFVTSFDLVAKLRASDGDRMGAATALLALSVCFPLEGQAKEAHAKLIDELLECGRPEIALAAAKSFFDLADERSAHEMEESVKLLQRSARASEGSLKRSEAFLSYQLSGTGTNVYASLPALDSHPELVGGMPLEGFSEGSWQGRAVALLRLGKTGESAAACKAIEPQSAELTDEAREILFRVLAAQTRRLDASLLPHATCDLSVFREALEEGIVSAILGPAREAAKSSKPTEAATMYEEAISSRPSSRASRTAVFELLQLKVKELGKEGAAEWLDSWRREHAGTEEEEYSHVALAGSKMKDRDYAGALRALDTELDEARPYHGEAVILKGQALARLGRFGEAASLMKKLADRKPGDVLAPKARFLAGWCLTFDGKRQEAESEFRAVIAGHPHSQYAEKAKAYLPDEGAEGR